MAKSTECKIRWSMGGYPSSLTFDVTNPLECENAELQLEWLHLMELPYSISGALFQGHGFPLAAVALMQPDTMHGAN